MDHWLLVSSSLIVVCADHPVWSTSPIHIPSSRSTRQTIARHHHHQLPTPPQHIILTYQHLGTVWYGLSPMPSYPLDTFPKHPSTSIRPHPSHIPHITPIDVNMSWYPDHLNISPPNHFSSHPRHFQDLPNHTQVTPNPTPPTPGTDLHFQSCLSGIGIQFQHCIGTSTCSCCPSG